MGEAERPDLVELGLAMLLYRLPDHLCRKPGLHVAVTLDLLVLKLEEPVTIRHELCLTAGILALHSSELPLEFSKSLVLLRLRELDGRLFIGNRCLPPDLQLCLETDNLLLFLRKLYLLPLSNAGKYR